MFTLIYCFIANSSAQNQIPIEIKSKARLAFKNDDKKNISLYKVSKPDFSEKKAYDIIDLLLPNASKQKIEKGNVIHFRKDQKNFKFFKSEGLYIFNDNDIESDLTDLPPKQTETINAITGNLLPEAEKMLEKLLKKEVDQFQFMNNEYEYITTGPGSENEFLKSVTFRFVRVQDELPICGSTNHIKITFDAKGRFSRLVIKDYKLEKLEMVKRKVKNDRLEKYLRKELKQPYFAKKPNGEPIAYTNIEVVDCINAYMPIDYKMQKVLLPHAYFKIKSKVASGETMKSRVFFPFDAEFAANVDPEDIIELEEPAK